MVPAFAISHTIPQQVMEDTLSTCPKLELLNLDSNRLHTLNEIPNILSLVTLKCAFNGISDLRQVAKLKACKVCNR